MIAAPMDETGLPKLPDPPKEYRLRLGPLSLTVVRGVLRASTRDKSAMRVSGVKLGIGSRSLLVRVPTGPIYVGCTRYTPEFLQDTHAMGGEVRIPPGAVWFLDPEDFTYRLYEHHRPPTLQERLDAARISFQKG